MPAISFEKISGPERGQAAISGFSHQTLSQQTMNQSTSSLAGQQIKTATGRTRGRGIVINWLDRLVERRMEKVERDIARIRKKSAGSATR